MSRPHALGLELVRRTDPRRAAVVVCATIGFLGFMGGLWGIEIRVPGFNLAAEGTIPAFFSSGLLVVASGLALLLSSEVEEGTRPLRFMAAFFAFMALDELVAIHERLEAATGVDWQTLYIPVVLVGGIAFIIVLRRLTVLRPAAAAWVGGAVVWVIAQLFERLQWSGSGHEWAVLPEETLEMLGSSLFGLALLLFLRSRLHRPGRRSGARA